MSLTVTLPPAWSAVPRSTLTDFADRVFTAGGDTPALLFDDGATFTFNQLRDGVERLAGALRSRIGAGDRVLLAIGNRAEYLIAYFAVIANRAVVVNAGPDLGPADAEHLVGQSSCRMALAEGRAVDVLRGLGPGSPLREVVALDRPEPDGFANWVGGTEPMPLSEAAGQQADLVDIGFTSGTTGMPKALGGTHLEPLRYADVQLRVSGLTADDRPFVPLQFYYGDGLYLALAAWQLGASIAVMRRFSVSRFWTAARAVGATRLYTIGSIPNLLLTAAPSPAERAHTIRSASAVGVPAAQHRELQERFGFPWLEVYGSSESGPALCMPPDLAERYVGTGAIGVPLPDVRARIVAADGTVVDGPGEGELELAGNVLFTGYLGDQAATDEMLHDGWLRMGDLVRRDEDGMYYFLGRAKEVIRRGGQNVAPAEVEAVLRRHPVVVDAAVVPVPDQLWGEEILAYVQVKSITGQTPADLAEFCAHHLAAFKVPRYVRLRDTAFPRTPSHRIVKRDLAPGGRHRSVGAWDRQATR
ncbi:ATP-dependent acyl-CoA ligase [Actinoplanes sichuanensis]|uniref:Class I adenylate-forming enzyme family protein n=1 Tax=Actinoplanes sichuanensis TaxID=512349 RepID=A0ABW4ATN8_9ACTN|nr:AMP-binding protein [Actinoplanes sichuanensis]BEL04440.1 ATP-dependent acyl-CoA ligase [Actinoplanes sichuanensis]